MAALTTELAAINTMLSIIGEAPVNTVEDTGLVDAKLAKQILTETNRLVQMDGWSWNRDDNYPLVPAYPLPGRIDVPESTLKVGSVSKLCASTNESLLLALSAGEPNVLYVYRNYTPGRRGCSRRGPGGPRRPGQGPLGGLHRERPLSRDPAGGWRLPRRDEHRAGHHGHGTCPTRSTSIGGPWRLKCPPSWQDPAFPNDPSKKVGVRYATGTRGDEFALPWGVPAEETIHVVCRGNDGNAAGRLQSRKVLINDAETGY